MDQTPDSGQEAQPHLLARTLQQVGLVFALSYVVNVTVDAKPVLVPVYGVVLAVPLAKLASMAPRPVAQRLLRGALAVDGVVVVAASVIWWSPAFSVCWVLVALGWLAVGPAVFSAGMAAWCRAEGWEPAGERYERASRWYAVAGAVLVAWMALFVILVEPGGRSPQSFVPEQLFGRAFGNWSWGLGFTALLVPSIVAMTSLRKASKTLRAGLRLGAQSLPGSAAADPL